MILTGPQIGELVAATKAGKAAGLFDPSKLGFREAIDVEPFDPARLGPNSYDVRLAPRVMMYDKCRALHDWYAARGWPVPYPTNAVLVRGFGPGGLDFWPPLAPLLMTEPEPGTTVDVPAAGMTLYPGVPYLMQTEEWVEAYGLRPDIDGRSSCGRLFLALHQTAGRGDDGFRGRFTCEVTVTWPVLLVPGVPLGQVSFTAVRGQQKPYGAGGRYQDQSEIVGSRLFRDFERLRASKIED